MGCISPSGISGTPPSRDPMHPRTFSRRNLYPILSFNIFQEISMAHPRQLPFPPTHLVSGAAAGWQNPLGTAGIVNSRFSARRWDDI